MILIHNSIRVVLLITGFVAILLLLADTAVEYSVGSSIGILHFLGIEYRYPFWIGVLAFVFSIIKLQKGSRAIYLIPAIIGLVILLILGLLYVLLQIYLFVNF
jgi:hypothetical protein